MSGLSWGASVRGKGCQDYRGKGGLRGASKVGEGENETKRCEKLLKFNRIKN